MGKTEKPKGRKDKPKKITIINNAPRLITLTYSVAKPGQPGQAIALTLNPGPNAVDRHVYETHLKKHPTVQKYATQRPGHRNERGRIVKKDEMILVIDESGPPATVGKEVEEAVAFVDSVCDAGLLYKMAEDEERGEVIQAIDERKAEIGTTEPVKED